MRQQVRCKVCQSVFADRSGERKLTCPNCHSQLELNLTGPNQILSLSVTCPDDEQYVASYNSKIGDACLGITEEEAEDLFEYLSDLCSESESDERAIQLGERDTPSEHYYSIELLQENSSFKAEFVDADGMAWEMYMYQRDAERLLAEVLLMRQSAEVDDRVIRDGS